METIIVPLDGSPLSAHAISFGVAFARAYGAELRLVHILEEPIAFDLLPSLLIPDRASAEAYLKRHATDVPSDVPVDTMVLRGYAAEVLVETAAAEQDAMLVMGTHGRGAARRAMLGSIADDVLRHATVPVVLVRGTATAPKNVFKTIMVPLDTSHYGEEALPLAIDLATQCDASVSLVNVCEPFWDSPYVAVAPELGPINQDVLEASQRELLAAGRAYLHRLADDMRTKGVQVTWEVRIGRPTDEILRAIETTGVDLVIIATHGRGGISRLAFGSVTNDILRHSSVPILAIPPRMLEQREREIAEMLSTY